MNSLGKLISTESKKVLTEPTANNFGALRFISFIGEGVNNLPNTDGWVGSKLEYITLRALAKGFNRILIPMVPGADYFSVSTALHLRPRFKGTEVWAVQPWPVEVNTLSVAQQIIHKFYIGQVDKLVELAPKKPGSVKERRDSRRQWYRRLVDKSEAVIVIWGNSPGHVSCAVDYAIKTGKPILQLNPIIRSEEWL